MFGSWYSISFNSSKQNCPSSVRLDVLCCHRFGNKLRTGPFKHIQVLNHWIVDLVVCLESCSCWKVNLHPSLRYLAPSIMPSTLTTLPFPADEKHLWDFDLIRPENFLLCLQHAFCQTPNDFIRFLFYSNTKSLNFDGWSLPGRVMDMLYNLSSFK